MDDKVKEDPKTAFLYFAVGMLLLPFTVTWLGYAASVLWAWFVVPVFQAPALTIPQAIGLALTASTFHRRGVADTKDKTAGQVFWKALGEAFWLPLLALGLGAVVRLFI